MVYIYGLLIVRIKNLSFFFILEKKNLVHLLSLILNSLIDKISINYTIFKRSVNNMKCLKKQVFYKLILVIKSAFLVE